MSSSEEEEEEEVQYGNESDKSSNDDDPNDMVDESGSNSGEDGSDSSENGSVQEDGPSEDSGDDLVAVADLQKPKKARKQPAPVAVVEEKLSPAELGALDRFLSRYGISWSDELTADAEIVLSRERPRILAHCQVQSRNEKGRALIQVPILLVLSDEEPPLVHILTPFTPTGHFSHGKKGVLRYVRKAIENVPFVLCETKTLSRKLPLWEKCAAMAAFAVFNFGPKRAAQKSAPFLKEWIAPKKGHISMVKNILSAMTRALADGKDVPYFYNEEAMGPEQEPRKPRPQKQLTPEEEEKKKKLEADKAAKEVARQKREAEAKAKEEKKKQAESDRLKAREASRLMEDRKDLLKAHKQAKEIVEKFKALERLNEDIQSMHEQVNNLKASDDPGDKATLKEKQKVLTSLKSSYTRATNAMDKKQLDEGKAREDLEKATSALEANTARLKELGTADAWFAEHDAPKPRAPRKKAAGPSEKGTGKANPASRREAAKPPKKEADSDEKPDVIEISSPDTDKTDEASTTEDDE